MAELIEGYDSEGYEDWCEDIYNAMKNHFRMVDPCANLAGIQPGMVVSDEADDKLYHYTGASGDPCEEVLQEVSSFDVTPLFTSVDLGANNVTTTTKAKAYLAADQLNIVNITWTKILLDTEDYDIGGDFDVGNNRFVAPVSGYYLITGNVLWKSGSVIADKSYWSAIYVDGALACATSFHASYNGPLGGVVSSIEYVAAGEYIELYCYHDAGANTPDINGGADWETYMVVHLMSI